MASSLLRLLFFLFVCLTLLPPTAANGSGGVLNFHDILPDDPRSYDKMRPPKRNGEPTRVHFHVTVMGIDSINENSMTYAADIFFAQSWKDHRLRLPENMTSEYRLLEVDWLKNMWRPDSFFKNAKQVTFQTMTIPNHYVWLYQSKIILYMVKLTLTLSCAMNYAIYPHDTQTCKLQMESLSHTTDDLIFEWDVDVPLVVDEYIELPQFDLVQNLTADCTQVYSTGNFTCLEVVFVLKRRLGYYLFHTYMPTCLIVIMSWVSFWIKPEAAPARVTLGVTSLLTLSTQHAKSQASLPPVSYIKIIDMFMSTCTIFVFLALMEYALVNIVLGDGPDGAGGPPKPPPGPPKENKRIFIPQMFTDKSCIHPSQERGHNGNSNLGVGAHLAHHHAHTVSHTQSHPHNPIAHNFPSIHHPPTPHAHHPQSPALPGHDSNALPNVPPPPPPPKGPPGPTGAQKRRAKAIMVDRFSRYFFPLTFGLINGVYWVIFCIYL
ncbi:glycine receptor subunit alpha-4-like isoform X2 [Oratosquilla oratoria]|uniref:glycine receptor subunit alpha-4-like isoform X2 n=1 Tax=Oratosquilla oratoria TaxID=337810 RepID=UPI003F772F65